MPILVDIIPRRALGVALAEGWDIAFAGTGVPHRVGRVVVGRRAGGDETHSEILDAFAALRRRVAAARLTGA